MDISNIPSADDERAPKDGSGYAIGRPMIEKTKYSHDAMIDVILANPGISQHSLAEFFGYSEPWISTILSSDAFRLKLAERRAELIDPTLMLTIEDRFKALANKSVEKLMQHLSQPVEVIDPEILIKAAALGAKSIGLGQPKIEQSTQSTEDRLKDLGWKLTKLLHQTKEDVETVSTITIEQKETDHEN